MLLKQTDESRKRAFLVDVAAQSSYLAHTMLRQLLTLLAIFTGLAVTGEHAHARVTGVENVRLASISEACEICTVRQASLAAQMARGPEKLRDSVDNCHHRAGVIYWPTIMLKVDRAHE
ncbi:hypothetical protein GRI39_05320 [Altererythrobacter indicus]|uniref:Uncharacterized protein n=1 Tax=Altericroceibacterium indicum TaxID=374177 RepID=A0A845A8X4_9SPHN|nr:hypothetical protein [Altericroceibacterium indicum]MXP25461.1 hypothetical protein [Altericroceibacterium indicum]